MAEKKKGRPTKFDPAICALAEKLSKLGATDKQMAECFEVSEVTLNAWKKQYPEFLKSLKAGKEEADARVAASLFHRAVGYEHPEVHVSNYQGEVTLTPLTKHYPPETTAGIFWLKNRRPDLWRDRIEHTGKDGKDLLPAADITEVARGLAYLLTRGAQEAKA